ncbi:hypothetical protein DYB25_009318 [Aphanomyces astaci]|uniref:Pseudouridine synthase RsuA/RluA-like domain-containing protein n=1 Tax=Aphanomyces astaci TaxID=112090 RepID=A0A397FN77_APHAT|nr:hypothetical protein DYB25_009318 [Aphanomyces astaci]RHY59680.1 hypothetical protein DYB38_006093 [Aphanomyces astaci]RHY67303.1 hypothetical protein DYB30_002269 [Aphanomyces astaci]RHZ08064.1 hypothetical protein DYB26_009824 [Aphanomyces astaci]RHZ30538.1 hypothetical protein DYB31_011569 [Aphanomyces astaci]
MFACASIVKVDAKFVLPDDANLRIGMTPELFLELSDAAITPSSTEHSNRKLPPELALPVLYEDDHLVALHKPVHLAAQLGTNTTDSVASRYPHWKLVHRLDKGATHPGHSLVDITSPGTSGVLLLAKTRVAAADMAALFRDNQVCPCLMSFLVVMYICLYQVHKTYIALVHGTPATGSSGTVHEPIDLQPAQTSYKVLPRSKRDPPSTSWLELHPHTGRKHQLRRHCAHVLQAPIVGDVRYGLNPSWKNRNSQPSHDKWVERDGRMMLHAHAIRFVHPCTQQLVHVQCVDMAFPTLKTSPKPY